MSRRGTLTAVTNRVCLVRVRLRVIKCSSNNLARTPPKKLDNGGPSELWDKNQFEYTAEKKWSWQQRKKTSKNVSGVQEKKRRLRGGVDSRETVKH